MELSASYDELGSALRVAYVPYLITMRLIPLKVTVAILGTIELRFPLNLGIPLLHLTAIS